MKNRGTILSMRTSARALLAWALLLVSAYAQPQTDRPNFVVVLIDDLGYGDIGPFGSKINSTPELDRMAAEGAKLTSFYAAPVCTPSRAQLLTGCYAQRVSLPDVLHPGAPIGISEKEHTVAELLKQRGYSTMCIGKWHLGDQPEFLPTRHGFDHYFGLPYSNDMGANWQPANHPNPAAGKPKRPPLPLVRDETVLQRVTREDQDDLTRLYTEEAVKFIRDNREQPFFLYFAHTAVHTPLHPGPAFKGRSSNGPFGDWVSETDWSVGQLLEELRKQGLDKNTMVIFTSDNGPWTTQGANGGVATPLKGGKGSTWEGGIRVPTLAWWPGRIPAGSTNDAMVSEMDILPTLVGLAGGKVPSDKVMDGKDIWPVLSGASRESPHEALFYFKGNYQLEAVRSGPWKLAIAVQSLNMSGIQSPPDFKPLLFNLDQDIGETTNVAAAHPTEVAKLEALVKKIGADLGTTGKPGPGVRPCGRVKDVAPLIGLNGVTRKGFEPGNSSEKPKQ
jgi:arylsulfatase A